MNQPYVFGQSGTDRPEPVLVTRPPAKISSAVDNATSVAKRWSSMGPCQVAVVLNEKGTSFVSFSPIVTVCGLRAERFVPRFDRVGAGRKAFQLEASLVCRHRVERVVEHARRMRSSSGARRT